MKKMTKKIIAICLTSLFAFPAFAASEAEQSVNLKLQEVFKNKNDFEPHEMKEIGMNGIFRFKIKDGSYGFTDGEAKYIFNGDLILTKVKDMPANSVYVIKHTEPYPEPVQNTTETSSQNTSVNAGKEVSQEPTESADQKVTNRLLNSQNNSENDTEIKKSENDAPVDLSAGTVPASKTDGALISFDPNSITYAKNEKTREGSIFYSRLPFESNSFTMTYGKGEREFALFVDPDCPFCREFDKNLKKNPDLVNAKVHVFYMPLNIHPYARTHANFLWCQKDKAEAYTSWMNYLEKTEETDPQIDGHINNVFNQWKIDTNRTNTDTKCEEDADAISVNNFRMASSLGIRSTPTIMLKNSAVMSSAITGADLNKYIIYSEKNPKVPEIEDLTYPSTLVK